VSALARSIQGSITLSLNRVAKSNRLSTLRHRQAGLSRPKNTQTRSSAQACDRRTRPGMGPRAAVKVRPRAASEWNDISSDLVEPRSPCGVPRAPNHPRRRRLRSHSRGGFGAEYGVCTRESTHNTRVPWAILAYRRLCSGPKTRLDVGLGLWSQLVVRLGSKRNRLQR
jgi:hypothetical protein